MKKFTKQKGITLIALIITVIVMLILVAVTINVALNGGLFEKAKTASDKTQKQADYESLLSAVIGSLDNTVKVNEDNLETNVENIGFTITGNDFPYTCESPSNNTFYVYENGEITDEPKTVTKINNVSDIDENKLYDVTFTAISQDVINQFSLDGMKMISVFDTNDNPVGSLVVLDQLGTKGAVLGTSTNQYNLTDGMWVVSSGDGESKNEIKISRVKILTNAETYAQQGGAFITQEILDSGIVKIEESGNNNPSVNEYGFYENVVYVSNDNADYLYFTGNIVKVKSPFGISDSNYNVSSRNPQYTLKNSETVDITGYVIEDGGRPFYLIKNNGNLLMLTVSFGENNEIESLEVIESNELLYSPNFNLNPDEIFTE